MNIANTSRAPHPSEQSWSGIDDQTSAVNMIVKYNHTTNLNH